MELLEDRNDVLKPLVENAVKARQAREAARKARDLVRRKSALSVHDRSDAGGESMAKSAPAGPSSHELLAKASVLCQQGKGGISGMDVARIEARLNRGEAIPPELVARINAAS